MNISLLINYGNGINIIYFNYFGKVIESKVFLHAARWSLKNLNIDQQILEKLKKAKSFRIKENGGNSFEIIGHRDADISTIISETEENSQSVAESLKQIPPYRFEMRTQSRVTNTRKGYIDFHIFNSMQVIPPYFSSFEKFAKLHRILCPESIKILRYCMQEKGCSQATIKKYVLPQASKATISRLLKKLEKYRIFTRIDKNPSFYEFTSEEIEYTTATLISSYLTLLKLVESSKLYNVTL